MSANPRAGKRPETGACGPSTARCRQREGVIDPDVAILDGDPEIIFEKADQVHRRRPLLQADFAGVDPRLESDLQNPGRTESFVCDPTVRGVRLAFLIYKEVRAGRGARGDVRLRADVHAVPGLAGGAPHEFRAGLTGGRAIGLAEMKYQRAARHRDEQAKQRPFHPWSPIHGQILYPRQFAQQNKTVSGKRPPAALGFHCDAYDTAITTGHAYRANDAL